MKYSLLYPVMLFCLTSTDDIYAQVLPPDQPLRSIHIAGIWGLNRQIAEAWDPDGGHPLIPADYVEHLKDLHVNWVGISVALHYDDSMDSTVERVYSRHLAVPTVSDRVLRQLIREFRSNGFDVYLTLAFESRSADVAARPVQRHQLGDPGRPDTGVPILLHALPILPEYWPWRPSHPDHDRFVQEFWETYTEQAVHFAKIAQQEGVRMYSLGTETDSLFRTRPGHNYWTNDYRQQLETMVRRVRSEYHGLLTYGMFSGEITDPWIAGSQHLWEDLDLDVVGVSAWFPLSESVPSTVTSVETLRGEYERIFDSHLVPLAHRNPGRPVVFLEYGAMDIVEEPYSPGGAKERNLEPVEYVDSNNNGVEDGRETQANIFQALFETMDRFPGVVYGAFFWENWIASDELWARKIEGRRGTDIRNKPAGEVVRAQYERWRSAESSQVYAAQTLPDRTLHVGVVATAAVIPVADAFRNAMTYEASSSAPEVAAVSMSGSTVTITSVAEGEATVTVTARGPDRSLATEQFNVTVLASPAPKPAQFLDLRRRLESLRGRAGGR